MEPGQLALEQRAQLLGQRFGHLWPAVKLRGRVLQQGDTPLARAIDRHYRLHGIDRWIDIRLPRRYHPDDRAQQRDIWREQADATNPGDVGRGDVVGEYLAERRGNLVASAHGATIEADALPLVVEKRGEGARVTPIPAIEQLR